MVPRHEGTHRADAGSDLVHTVRGAAANVNDVVEANSLLRGDKTDASKDAGCKGAHNRPTHPST